MRGKKIEIVTSCSISHTFSAPGLPPLLPLDVGTKAIIVNANQILWKGTAVCSRKRQSDLMLNSRGCLLARARVEWPNWSRAQVILRNSCFLRVIARAPKRKRKSRIHIYLNKNDDMQYGGAANAFGNLVSNGSYSFSNPVFASLAGYSSMALLKMLGMSTYTIVQRCRTGSFITPEDDVYKQLMNQLGLSSGGGSVTGNRNDSVERARENHLNDLENIIPFVLVGLFYIGTRPKFDCALWHFRIFLLSRLLHTIAYQVDLKVYVAFARFRFINVIGSVTSTDTYNFMVTRLFKYHFNGNPHPSLDSALKHTNASELTCRPEANANDGNKLGAKQKGWRRRVTYFLSRFY